MATQGSAFATCTRTQSLQVDTFEVFLNEQPLANIPYFAAVASKFRITIDTELDPFINVNLHYGTRIKKHRERVVTAIWNKYTQLEDMKVMRELNSDSLKRSQNKVALSAINLIKETRS